MTITEWRQDKTLVLRAKKLIESPDFQAMLATLRESNPVHYPLPKAGVSDGDRSAQLGRIEGACYAIDALLSLGEYQPPTKEPEQSYR